MRFSSPVLDGASKSILIVDVHYLFLKPFNIKNICEILTAEAQDA